MSDINPPTYREFGETVLACFAIVFTFGSLYVAACAAYYYATKRGNEERKTDAF